MAGSGARAVVASSTEGIYIDLAFSQGCVHQPAMADEGQAKAWKPVVSGIKAHGSLAIAQIMHAGAISQGNRFSETRKKDASAHVVSPSTMSVSKPSASH